MAKDISELTPAELRDLAAQREADEAAAKASERRAAQAVGGGAVPDHVHVAAGHHEGTGDIATGPVFRGE